MTSMPDPKKLFEPEEIRWEQIKEGDWIRPKKWSRARRVELIEYRDGQRILFLADPDQEEPREIDLDAFVSRAVSGKKQEELSADGGPIPVWFSVPRLRRIWEAAASAG
jgi:hypothetical protein